MTTAATLGEALAAEDGAWARTHLGEDVVGWLTTVAPDGTPQTSVIAFLPDGETIFFYSQPDTPKLRNIAGSPHVCFHLQSDPYGDHVLVVEGTAEVDPSIPASDRHPAYLAKYREVYVHWAMDAGQTAADFSVPIRITPRRVRVF